MVNGYLDRWLITSNAGFGDSKDLHFSLRGRDGGLHLDDHGWILATDGWMDGLMDGWMNGWMEGEMSGWVNR